MMSPSASTPRSTVSGWTGFDTGFGTGWIGWSPDGMIETRLPGTEPCPTSAEVPAGVRRLVAALQAYFCGDGALPDAEQTWLDGCSDFERDVYETLLAVPAGATITYSGLARSAGHPMAARAVGAAMARNRWAPMIPCHRVVASDGGLRGYAGGVELKRALLEMESA